MAPAALATATVISMSTRMSSREPAAAEAAAPAGARSSVSNTCFSASLSQDALARAIGQKGVGQKREQHRRGAFDDEQPLPSFQAAGLHTQEQACDRIAHQARDRLGEKGDRQSRGAEALWKPEVTHRNIPRRPSGFGQAQQETVDVERGRAGDESGAERDHAQASMMAANHKPGADAREAMLLGMPSRQ